MVILAFFASNVKKICGGFAAGFRKQNP